MADSLEDSIRSNRVFILGAGFSASAGVPLTPELFRTAMDTFRANLPGVFSRIDSYARVCYQIAENEEPDYASVGLAELCTFLAYIELRECGGGERWADEGCREKLALRYYLSKVIAKRTPVGDEVPDLYVSFAQQLHQGDVVLSFNWDCLLEKALDQVGKPYTYDFDGTGIWLFKLHGSINWRVGELPDKARLDWTPVSVANPLDGKRVHSAHDLTFPQTWDYFPPLGEAQPFLVLPGYGKAFDVRMLSVLWYKPEWAFAFTHDVYIIGLSLSRDDFFIRSFFLHRLRHIHRYTGVPGRTITIINPDVAAEENYGFCLFSGSARLVNECFGLSHVEMMRARLDGH